MADELKSEETKTESVEQVKVEETQKEESKGFSQSELDEIVSKRVLRERKKWEDKISEIDVEGYDKWKTQQKDLEIESQKKKGEFEKILKDTVDSKDKEITKLQSTLNKQLIEGQLMSTASSQGAIKPDQIVSLLKGNLKLGDNGSVEVIDDQGVQRYNKKGDPLTIHEYVTEFLDTNPHYQSPTPSGTGSVGKVGGSTQKPFNIADLDMTKAEDRQKYAEYRKKRESSPTVINLTNN